MSSSLNDTANMVSRYSSTAVVPQRAGSIARVQTFVLDLGTSPMQRKSSPNLALGDASPGESTPKLHLGCCLLVVTPLICVGVFLLYWWAVSKNEQREMEATRSAVKKLGGIASFHPDSCLLDVRVAHPDNQTIGALKPFSPPGPLMPFSLHTLVLGNYDEPSPLSDEGLKELPQLQSLTSLTLQNMSITDEGLAYLPQLTCLHISRISITDDGLRHIGTITSLRQLLLLELQISDRGLKHLRNLKRLEILGLDGCPIEGEGLKKLGTLSQLHALSLDSTRITASGVEHLKALPTIQRLSLEDTEIDDDALKHLEGMHQLWEIHLGGTRVTEEGVERLVKALPRTSIHFRGRIFRAESKGVGSLFLKRTPDPFDLSCLDGCEPEPGGGRRRAERGDRIHLGPSQPFGGGFRVSGRRSAERGDPDGRARL